MLELRAWDATLDEILAAEMSAEEVLQAEALYKPLLRLRTRPDIAIHALSGVFLPPHQRLMLTTAHHGVPTTVFVCSRGTSKSAVVVVLYGSYKALFFGKRKIVDLSNTGFRGGMWLYDDLAKWVNGDWDDQEAGLLFWKHSIKNDNVIHRGQNQWDIDFTSASQRMTLPTKNPDDIRGKRAHDLYLDEANWMESDLIDKVAGSFGNVLKGFRTGGDDADANTVTYTTTIDYSWRDFQRTAHSAHEALRREYEAFRAAARGDRATYRTLAEKGLGKELYFSLDYTDTLIRREITTRDGRRFEVRWPDPTRKFRWDPTGVPFTARDAAGQIQREGVPGHVLATYPINRENETKMLSGAKPEPVFLAEERNVVDSAAGDVYPHAIIDRAASKHGRHVLAWDKCPEAYRQAYPDPERHWAPTVQYRCTDPCVLGVDYAPGSRDFFAMVVIRVGPLATGPFNPLTGLGRTPFSNVLWTEQHRLTSAKQAADAVFAMAERYNLVYFHDTGELDDWKLCRAVGLDVRNAGTGVRDELLRLSQQELQPGEYRIYDPLDPDPRVQAFATDGRAKPMLDAITPTGPLNNKMVEFTVAQLGEGMLYLPKDLPPSQRPNDRRLDHAFDAAVALEHQLRSLQQEPTAAGYMHYYMKGDEEQVKNKKDLWAAFIYAAKQLRAHLIRQRMLDDAPPPLAALVARRRDGQNPRHARGARRW